MTSGDQVLIDNHSAHHGAADFALGQSLDTQDLEVLYTPVHSPEVNPVEMLLTK